MGSHINWMIIRNNHAYLLKRSGVKRPFSSEPGNLRNVNNFRFSGLVNAPSLDISPNKKGNGFVLTHRSSRNTARPGKNYIKTTMASKPRGALSSLRSFLKANRYPAEMVKPALRRASAIHKSKKVAGFKKPKKARKGAKSSKSKSGDKKTEKVSKKTAKGSKKSE